MTPYYDTCYDSLLKIYISLYITIFQLYAINTADILSEFLRDRSHCRHFTLSVYCCMNKWARSFWLRRLRPGSAAIRLLGYGFESGWSMDACLLWVLCCQVGLTATGWSLVQRGLTEYGVCQCDSEGLIMVMPLPTGGCLATRKKLQ